MANWIEDLNIENTEKIRMAGKNIIVVPARNDSAPIDTFDVFDGDSHEYIATDVPEKAATEFAVIWNSLLADGESVENIRKFNIDLLTGVKRKNYSR